MNQSIMVAPAPYPRKPRCQTPELRLAELAGAAFKQEYAENLFFEKCSCKEMLGNIEHCCGSIPLLEFPPCLASRPPESARVPAMRFDFLFEKPLDSAGMFGGSAALQHAAQFSRQPPGVRFVAGFLQGLEESGGRSVLS